jgi:hypothetical protein
MDINKSADRRRIVRGIHRRLGSEADIVGKPGLSRSIDQFVNSTSGKIVPGANREKHMSELVPL